MTNVPRLTFSPKDAEKLSQIPGLHLHGLHATGSVDALAAGARLIGQAFRYQRPIQPVLLSKEATERAREYQLKGMEWIIRTVSAHGGAILSDEMGLGKTFQTISVLREVMVGRALILVPARVGETWRDELLKWGFAESEIAILHGQSTKAEWARAVSAKVVVSSHDYRIIERTMNDAFADSYPEWMVIDEAHRFRGRDTKKGDLVEDISQLIPFKLMLTGSPQWNSMQDWYAPLKILFGYRFGSAYNFFMRYCGARPGEFGGLRFPRKEDKSITPKILNTEELQLRLSYYMLGRLKSEVAADLPPMTINIRWVDPTPEAKRALQKMLVGTRTSGSPVHDAIVATLKGKVEETLAIAAEASRFVLTTWTNAGASDLHRLLNERGTRCLLLSASQSAKARSNTIKEAIAQRCGLVATTDLLAEGLNLQKVASTGILHALDFVPEKMRQLMARLHRIDIVDPVTWHIVAMKESVDQYIIDAGVFKLDNMERTLGKKTELRGALKNDKQEAISEREALENLYATMEVGDHEQGKD